MKKPTLVFVHGAWHGPQCWEKVVPKLEDHGLKCIAPQMDYTGTEKPIDNLDSSIEQLQDIIASETAAGNDVIMVVHSFGGVSGSSAVRGFTAKDSPKLKSKESGKVIGIAFMCAMVIPTRTSFHVYQGLEEPHSTPIGAPADDGWTTLLADPKVIFYQDLPDEEARKWEGLLKKQSFGPLISDDGVYAGWQDVPIWYLVCENDAVFPTDFQERMINDAKKLGAQVEVRRTDAGHSPFLSRVDDSVKFVVDAAEAFSKS